MDENLTLAPDFYKHCISHITFCKADRTDPKFAVLKMNYSVCQISVIERAVLLECRK